VVVVSRATFATGVSEREPVDSIDTLTNDQTKVYFFSEIQGTPGQAITHRWEHDDQVMAEVSFTTGGTRWRVYSSKQLFPGWLGDWTVVVLDGSMNEVARHQFAYVPASESPPASPAEEEAISPVETAPPMESAEPPEGQPLLDD
jgi:hypothetical protein